jgi:uncharacterized protein (DUF433 family)
VYASGSYSDIIKELWIMNYTGTLLRCSSLIALLKASLTGLLDIFPELDLSHIQMGNFALLMFYNNFEKNMKWHNHISINPEILTGKPTIKGTRIAVELILEKLAEGETIDQILESHPHINKEAILACLSYAADSLKNELIFPITK